MSTSRVLFVDDEPHLLNGIQRSLHKHVDMETAESAAAGLLKLQDSGEFALVVSDMRMPNMNGAQFLAKVRERAPDTVRMILSGQSDLEATIAAVNQGQIFRFLNKPISPEQLLIAVNDGIRQHHLQTAEKVLLEQTLSSSVKMLIEILGMVNPMASSKASRLQRYVLELSGALKLPPSWVWGLSAFVSQIGCVALPKEMLTKVEAGQSLTEEEGKLYYSHPEVASRLLAGIPRLDDVAAIVGSQLQPVNFAAKPPELEKWSIRDQGHLLLHLTLLFDGAIGRGLNRDAAVSSLIATVPGLPRAIGQALLVLHVATHEFKVRQITIKDLIPGMILDEDLVSPKGIRLVPQGQEVTRSLMIRLASIASGVGVSEPFRVRFASSTVR